MSTKLRSSSGRYFAEAIGVNLMRVATVINAGVIVAILFYLLDNALPALS